MVHVLYVGPWERANLYFRSRRSAQPVVPQSLDNGRQWTMEALSKSPRLLVLPVIFPQSSTRALQENNDRKMNQSEHAILPEVALER